MLILDVVFLKLEMDRDELFYLEISRDRKDIFDFFIFMVSKMNKEGVDIKLFVFSEENI